MPCYSPLKGWRDGDTGGIVFRAKESDGSEMEVACGSCLGCRLDRSRTWAMRILHESSEHSRNCFITLTYDNENCPVDFSLEKTHLQKFWKRLRKKKGKLRYYACGEYGDVCEHQLSASGKGELPKCPSCNTGRPHYHACVFGTGFEDLELIGENNGVPYFTSPELASVWQKGHVQVGELNYESAAYVARYVLKKITGNQAKDWYTRVDTITGEITEKVPEFVTMSRKPGIARDWYQANKDDLFPHDHVPVPGKPPIKGMPRYYNEIFKKEEPLSYAEIQEARKRFMEEHAEEYTPGRLYQKYKVKKAQVEQLKRGLPE